MTTQTKTFIEVSDIIGLRVDCGKCGATVTLPISDGMNFKGLSRCQNCNEPWLDVMKSTIEPEVSACASAIKAASDRLAAWQKSLKEHGSSGFSLTLEVAKSVEEE